MEIKGKEWAYEHCLNLLNKFSRNGSHNHLF